LRRLLPLVLLYILLGYGLKGSVLPDGSLASILWDSRAHYTLIYAAAVFATATGLVMKHD